MALIAEQKLRTLVTVGVAAEEDPVTVHVRMAYERTRGFSIPVAWAAGVVMTSAGIDRFLVIAGSTPFKRNRIARQKRRDTY